MNIEIVEEAGYASALQGLALSYNKTAIEVQSVSLKLYNMDGGHNKFLESIIAWIQIDAPRYWWQQFDTYRIGVTKQSGSTMHTLMKRHLNQDDFESSISDTTLCRLNALIDEKDFDHLKNELPEGFLQTRIICANYMTLRRIVSQRMSHKLIQWQQFCDVIIHTVEYPEYFSDLKERFDEHTINRRKDRSNPA